MSVATFLALSPPLAVETLAANYTRGKVEPHCTSVQANNNNLCLCWSQPTSNCEQGWSAICSTTAATTSTKTVRMSKLDSGLSLPYPKQWKCDDVSDMATMKWRKPRSRNCSNFLIKRNRWRKSPAMRVWSGPHHHSHQHQWLQLRCHPTPWTVFEKVIYGKVY